MYFWIRAKFAACDTLNPVYLSQRKTLTHNNRSNDSHNSRRLRYHIGFILNSLKTAGLMLLHRTQIYRRNKASVCVMARLVSPSPDERTCPNQHSGNEGNADKQLPSNRATNRVSVGLGMRPNVTASTAESNLVEARACVCDGLSDFYPITWTSVN